MATTVRSLVARAREYLGDYGDGATTLKTTIDANAVTLSVENAGSPFSPNSWATIGDESIRVLTADKDAGTLGVLRGQRGTTAASHTAGDYIFANQIFTNDRICDALNEALARAYPSLFKVVMDVTTVVVEDDFEAAIPSGIDRLVRVEIETSFDLEEFRPIRDWELINNSTIRLYGAQTTGQTIRFVGTARFPVLDIDDADLDSEYPTDRTAIDYLVYRATASLLRQRQTEIARRDAFIGMTDTFGENQPNTTLVSARELDGYAEELLRQAAATMPPLIEYTPHPLRKYR